MTPNGEVTLADLGEMTVPLDIRGYQEENTYVSHAYYRQFYSFLVVRSYLTRPAVRATHHPGPNTTEVPPDGRCRSRRFLLFTSRTIGPSNMSGHV